MNQFERGETVDAVDDTECARIAVADGIEQPINAGAFSEYMFGNFFATEVVRWSVKFPIANLVLHIHQGFNRAFRENMILTIGVYYFHFCLFICEISLSNVSKSIFGVLSILGRKDFID